MQDPLFPLVPVSSRSTGTSAAGSSTGTGGAMVKNASMVVLGVYDRGCVLEREVWLDGKAERGGAGAGQRTRYAEVCERLRCRSSPSPQGIYAPKPCSCRSGCASSEYFYSASDGADRAECFGPASCLHVPPYKTIKRTVAPERTAPSFTLLMKSCCLCAVSSVRRILLQR